MRRLLLVFTLLASLTALGGKKQGQALIDSLKGELTKAAEDSNKVKLYIDLSNAVHLADPGAGVQYSTQALQLAEDIKWIKGQARAQVSLGVNLNQRGELGEAMKHYSRGMELFEQLHNERGVAQASWGMGNIYNVQKNYPKALEYQFKALALYSRTGDKQSSSYIMGNIANNYMMMEKYDTALLYYQRSMDYKREVGDERGEAVDLMNVAAVHFKRNELNAALRNYHIALSKMDTAADKILYARMLSNSGSCYVKSVVDSVAMQPDSLVPADKTSMLLKGIDLIKNGVRLSYETGDVEQLYNCYNDLAEAYRYLGEYKLALESADLAHKYQDSVYSQENNLKIAEVESKLKLNLKEKDVQIARLRSQVYIICIGILLVVVALVVVKIIKQARSNKKLADEKTRHVGYINAQNRILERISHIQSHDLRGSVTNILGFLELYNNDQPGDPNNEELIKGITAAAKKLDRSITEVVKEENQLMKDIKNEAGI